MVACLSIITLVETEFRTTTIMETTSSSNNSVYLDLMEFKDPTKVIIETKVKLNLNRTIKMFPSLF